MLKLAVLVSGGGTNLQALIDQIEQKKLPEVKIEVVISNNQNAYALERAKKYGIAAQAIVRKDYPNKIDFEAALLQLIDSFQVDLIVLAGCLLIIPEKVVQSYKNRIINIHPSLIPSFCGAGFYGLKVHEEALARGVKVTGATVHFVDEGTDTGPIILQKPVYVEENDTPETLQRRVMEQAEWNILPEAVRLISEGRITIEGRKVKIERNLEANMKVLIIGGGGREHAIARKVSMSPKVSKLYCAPGNAGIEECAECVNIGVLDFDSLADFAEKEKIDLTIVGPDDPLVAGVVDVFEARGLRVFGPRKNAAIIEGSKAFSKDLMKKYHIPCAASETFHSSKDALDYLKSSRYPIVLKADGLALGKGVLICNNFEEAKEGVKLIMEDKHFGSAGDNLVIEEFMTGREVSVLCFCDGTNIKPMTSAQDHKRAKDGDEGLNTGGMGTFSPSPFYTTEIDEYCRTSIYQPTMDAMKAEGREFIGILFVGLMLTKDGPKVLEYNARFGDPETQVVLPRMENDLVEVFEACIDGKLSQIDLHFADNAAVCVVLASEGYPEHYEKGIPIKGLESFNTRKDYYAFHAGTKRVGDDIVTNGGRVLGITATGSDLREARKKAYEATEWVQFSNKYMRNDIGKAIEEAK